MAKDFVTPELYYAQLARVRQGAGALITSPDGRVVMYDVATAQVDRLRARIIKSSE
jgi:hypothetical protein